MIPAKLEIPEEKAQEANIKIIQLIDEGIIKSVSYGQELKIPEFSKICSCGLNVSSEFQKFDRLKQELKKDKPDLWLAQDIINDIRIESIEKHCNLNLQEEARLLDKAKTDIINKEYDEARNKIQRADSQSWNKLLKCEENETL